MSDLKALQTIQYEGEDVSFIEHEGMRVYPVFSVGKMYGYTKKSSDQAFDRNKDFLEGNYYILTVRINGRKTSIVCLTGEGVWIYTSRLSVREIPEDRQRVIIKMVQFMAKSAQGVIEGKLVPAKSQLNYFEERGSVANNHKLLMAAVKQYEAPQFGKSRLPYQRESRAINEDIAGVHIHGMNDMLNAAGLRVKNDAYISDRSLMIAGVPFEPRHKVVKQFIDETYPRRTLCDMLLTVEERARVSRKCPATQRGISDFMAVTA